MKGVPNGDIEKVMISQTWEKFKRSGSVIDYMVYSRLNNLKDDTID